MKSTKILLKDINNAASSYSNAVNVWGANNQITIRAMIKWDELKKQYYKQQDCKSKKNQ